MTQNMATAYLITGGSVVDGTGAPAIRADVRVRDGRITEIGSDLTDLGETRLDASGCYVTPGFIDTHTHYDASLFWDAHCDPIVLHGVTTVLIGNCGLGLAPIRPDEIPNLSTLFSYIEDLPRDLFASDVPWNWESFPEYAAVMHARPLGVNVSALVSHSLIRLYEMGADAWTRAATAEEVEKMRVNVEAAMKAGALGVSTSRFDRSPAGDFVPSYYADDAEVEAIFETVAKFGGIVQMIADLSSLDSWVADLRRYGEFSRRFQVPLISNAIYQRPDDPSVAETLLAVGKELQAAGAPFYHLVSPRSIELLVNFEQCMLFMYVSAWNDLVQPTVAREEKLRMLADPEWRARARQDWDGAVGGFPSNGAERVLKIIKVGTPENEQYLGKTFDAILDQRPGHPSDVIADWVIENKLDAEFVHRYTNTDADMVGQLLAAPQNIISASDAGAHVAMFDGAGDTTCVLTLHVRDRNDLTIENAVARMTGEQARVLGLKERGLLKVGMVADLAVFDLDELQWEPEYKVSDLPDGGARFRRPPGRFRATFVNGTLAQKDGTSLQEFAGAFLGDAHRCARPPFIPEGSE